MQEREEEMESKKRVFLIVLDSVGIGEMPDAADYGDEGSNTVYAASRSPYFKMPNLQKLGFFNISGVKAEKYAPAESYLGTVMRLKELSKGKDTTTGHWEIAGIVSREPMPVFPQGFPPELIEKLKEKTGRKIF